MTSSHIIVDGSNIATEGRSTPSLAQLEEAVSELRREFPDAEVTVVVDASFAHRIDHSELKSFEDAELRGEYVSPPAGAIGRGDAFLLRIAERVDATVLSNDSFQEFHGEHPWLFERGRLIGASRVPGIGWIFVPRTPVRGSRSRVVTRNGQKEKQRVVKAIAEATREAVTPDPFLDNALGDGSSLVRKPRSAGQQAVNDPITFITFIAENRPGDVVEGEVEAFTSHGAVVRCGEVRCYAPLSGLGSPPPKSAREVIQRGDRRAFVITALDPHRRGVEVGLPDVAVVSGHPSDETVEAEVRLARRESSRSHSAKREVSRENKSSPKPLAKTRAGSSAVHVPDKRAAVAGPGASRTSTSRDLPVRQGGSRNAVGKTKVADESSPSVSKKRPSPRPVEAKETSVAPKKRRLPARPKQRAGKLPSVESPRNASATSSRRDESSSPAVSRRAPRRAPRRTQNEP